MSPTVAVLSLPASLDAAMLPRGLRLDARDSLQRSISFTRTRTGPKMEPTCWHGSCRSASCPWEPWPAS